MKYWKHLIFAALVAILATSIITMGGNPTVLLKSCLDKIAAIGWPGPILFILLYIFACIFLLPGAPLTLGAGAIWGLLPGVAYVWIGATLGALGAFLTGRHLAGKWVQHKLASNSKYKSIDNAIAVEGWKIAFLTRLTPAIPFNLLNYTLGLTKISTPTYLLTTALGILPGVILYTYIGTLGGELLSARETTTSGGGAALALKLTGFAATIIVTLIIVRIAKKALSGKT